MKLVLHNYWRSSASQRVRIALGLKQLTYEYVPVNIVTDQQRADSYLARNPLAQVPALEVVQPDGSTRVLVQSLPILEYLEERFPEVPLLPAEPYLRARARALAEIVNSGIQPHQNLSTTRRLEALGISPGDWVKAFVADGLAAFARAAAETASAFCVGDAPSVADCCLVPQLASARRFHVPLDPTGPLAQLLAIESRCLDLPAFAAAAPDQQPDAVRA